MKHLVSSLAVALVATLMMYAPAQAAVSQAGAEIQQIKIELIDLDPTDSITPWIDIVEQRPSVQVWGPSGVPSRALSDFGQVSAFGLGGSVLADVAPTALRAAAQVDSTDLPGEFYSALAILDSDFVLSPATGLRVSAIGRLFIDGLDQTGESAKVSIRTALFNPGAPASVDEVIRRSDLDANGFYTLSSYLESGQVAQEGRLYIQAIADSRFPSLVPEPSTYALLLAGLAIVGATARRKAAGRQA